MCFAMPLFSYSQLNKFDLSSYKLPDILTRKLDFQFDFNGSQSRSNYWNDSTSSKKRNSILNGDFNLSYEQFRNSEKYQGSLKTDFSLVAQNSWRYEEDTTIRNNIDPTLNFQTINRFYKDNKHFYELSLIFNTGRSSYTYTKGYHTKVDANFLMGMGRIEPIEDARLAVYILQDLLENGKLLRTPNSDEVLRIAEKISELKKKRFFDHRNRKIYELRSMDSLFKGMGIIKDNDIGYFTVLNDNWSYSTGPARWSGSRLSAGIKISEDITFYKYGMSEIENNFWKRYITTPTFGPMFQARWDKPINLHWQRKISLRSIVYLTSIQMITDALKEDGQALMTYWDNKFDMGYNYYPNSRTSLGFIGGFDFESSFNDWDQGFPIEIRPFLNLSVEYYFSSQLRMNIAVNSRFGYSNLHPSYWHEGLYTGKEDFVYFANGSLLYSIF